MLHLTGRGMRSGAIPNEKESTKWLRHACRHRHCDAMHALAWILLRREDYKGALRVLYCAAKEGHEQSSEVVADMYRRGLGVVLDQEKSSSWYEIAAEQKKNCIRPETMLWRLGIPCFVPTST